jgi:hypothetical protein
MHQAKITNSQPCVIKPAATTAREFTHEKNHGTKTNTRLVTHAKLAYIATGNHISSIWFWSSFDLSIDLAKTRISGRNSAPRSNHSVRHTANWSIGSYPRFTNSSSSQSDRKPQQGAATRQLVIITGTKKPPCTNARRLGGFIFQPWRVAQVRPVNIWAQVFTANLSGCFSIHIDAKILASTAITARNLPKMG